LLLNQRRPAPFETPPARRIFDHHGGERSAPEKLIRKLGDSERVTTDGPQAAGYAVWASGLSVTV
jgi:hypothetical protein